MSSAVSQSLLRLRAATANSKRVTQGLTLDIVDRFADDKRLVAAVDSAHQYIEGLKAKHPKLLTTDEEKLVHELQTGYVNFYNPEAVMPYVPAAAKGPWIVTVHGAVLHDSGGYGMLGFGHNDDRITPSVGRDQCMANVMTPAVSQMEFFQAFKAQIGWNRKDGKCPYSRIMCMNSGSEAVELSARLTDVHAKKMTEKGGVHEGWKVQMMVLDGSFYGRTYRPARLSHSCREIYQEHLASFQHPECHLPIVIKPNDIAGIEAAFANAAKNKIHIEALYMEPVMGEGQPGVALDRAFYDAARRLTKQHHSLLITDSIQAALRAKGALSVVDYPGFEDADAPDMETYSKALNGGQFPLSVLALQEHIASRYVVGLYGNTKTTNPRALDIARDVLNNVTPSIRKNILERGVEFQSVFGELCKKYPSVLSHVTGSGLIQAVHLRSNIPMFGGIHAGTKSFLARCRHNGLGVINAGHAVKFTPHFELTSKEIVAARDAFEQVTKTYL